MVLRTLGALCVLLMGFGIAQGQDEAPALKVESSGETVYDFKFNAKLEPGVDHSSPESIVNCWTLMTDGRDATDAASKLARDKFRELAAQELQRIEAELLTETLAEATAENRNKKEEDRFKPGVKHPSRIVESAKQEDGSVLVTVAQAEDFDRVVDGESVTETRERFERIRCEEVDGKWYIAGIEVGMQRKAGSEDEPETVEWQAKNTHHLGVYYDVVDDDMLTLVRPDIKTATAGEAALSLLQELRGLKFDLRFHEIVLAISEFGKLIEPMFTKGFQDATRKTVEERKAMGKKPKDPPPEVQELRDETDTSATVVIKQSDPKAGEQWVVKVEKVGESWRVAELGKLRDIGTDNEFYRAYEDIYGWG